MVKYCKRLDEISMNNDLEKAIDILNNNSNYTCVLCKDDITFSSDKRGVAPLLNWIKEKVDFKDFCAADKVVGKATAFLYVKLHVRCVYARVMSKSAVWILENNNIEYYFDEVVDKVLNRTSTGQCPMEEAVMGIDDCNKALDVIKIRLNELQKK